MISISGLNKNYGGQVLYRDASLQVYPGEKVGLVGPNGAGKTTIFRILTGQESFDSGQVSIPDRIRMSYFSQNVGELKGKTAIQEVLEGNKRAFELRQLMNEIEKVLETGDIDGDEMEKVLNRLGEYQEEFEKIGGYDLETQAEEILTGLGILPEEHQKDCGFFSGGWKMRIALAKVLIAKPDIILMDEPTNYLDMETILWLEEWINNFKGAVLLTTHDREFMNNIVDRIVEVGNQTMTSYTGDYDYFLREREIRRKQQEAAYQRQQDMLAKEEEFIARFAARASHAAQVQSRVKKLDKIERVELPTDEATMAFEFASPPRGSNDVAVMKDLGKFWPYPDGKPHWVFRHLNGQINRLDKLAVVGVNGAGKSTLLKVIAQLTEPSEGSVAIGPSCVVGYFGQFTLEVLHPEWTVFDEVRAKLAHVSDGYIRNLLAAFLFRGDDVYKKVKILSGGEKARLVLATLLAMNCNVLILDEPTNHLDIKSREILLEAMKNFDGTVIYVSHDRYFLNQLSTRVLQVDRGGVTVYDGGYDYYLEKTKKKA